MAGPTQSPPVQMATDPRPAEPATPPVADPALMPKPALPQTLQPARAAPNHLAPVDAVDASALTTPAATPGHSHPTLVHNLSTQLAKAATRSDKDDKVELLLDPVELGRVRFEFTTTGDRVQVTLSVERPETLDLLRRHADALRAEFRDAGIDSSTLSFGTWGKDRQDPQHPAPFAGGPTDPDDPPGPEARPAPTPPKTATDQGLDLRL